MEASISKYALRALEDAVAEKQSDANPFVREGETTFMRYDNICISQQSSGIISVDFSWRGMIVYTMREDCNFADGQSFTVVGIEGRMGVKAF